MAEVAGRELHHPLTITRSMTKPKGNEFYRPAQHRRDMEKMTEEEVFEELKVARNRLMLASAFVDFMRFAYGHLLNHGVNFMTLGAYNDQSILVDAEKLPPSRGADRYIEWLGRVRHDITAAVTRKGLRVVQSRRTPPPRTTKE